MIDCKDCRYCLVIAGNSSLMDSTSNETGVKKREVCYYLFDNRIESRTPSTEAMRNGKCGKSAELFRPRMVKA
ncbi:MAG: hypothetical protein OEX19_16040 [Gammaproteobacteria bacterium]|nr:hypothetical protein [Gammaproteobacteria bacterium]